MKKNVFFDFRNPQLKYMYKSMTYLVQLIENILRASNFIIIIIFINFHVEKDLRFPYKYLDLERYSSM